MASQKAAAPPPTGPPALLTALVNFLHAATCRLVAFCAYIPPEIVVAACSEKEIATMFKVGLTEAAAIKVAAANASF